MIRPLRLSLALLALSASLVAGEAYGVPPGWLKKPSYKGLLGNPPGTVTHVYWDGTSIRDVMKLPWAKTGADVSQVAASGGRPAGATGFANTSYYSLDPNGDANDPLDFSGDRWLCVVFSPTAYGSAEIYNNGKSGDTGYGLILPTQVIYHCGVGANSTTRSGAILNSLNVMCAGRAGTGASAALVMLNGDLYSYGAAYDTPGTTYQARIGRYSYGGTTVGFSGTIYEVLEVRGTPTVDLFYSMQLPILQANKPYNIVHIGDSMTAANSLVSHQTKLGNTLGSPWITHNRGVNARRVATEVTEYESIRGGPWSYLSILGGTPDLQNDGDAASIFGSLQTIYDEARADGVKVLVWTILPFKSAAWYTAAREATRQSVNTSIRNYAAAHPGEVVLVESATAFDDGAGAMQASLVQGDNYHPNQPGQDLMATLAYNAGHTAGWW